MAASFNFNDFISNLERETRGHRFSAPSGSGPVVKLDDKPLYPGFIYGYNCQSTVDHRVWNAVFSRMSSPNSPDCKPPSPVVIHFDVDSLPVSRATDNYVVSNLSAFELIMDAHIKNGDSFFILTPVQNITIETESPFITTADALHELRGLLQSDRDDGVKPTVLVLAPEETEGANHSRRALSIYSEYIFNRFSY